MKEYDKTIHTGLFTDEAFQLLDAFIMSALKRYESETYYQLTTIGLERAPDGEILLSQDDWNGYARSIWKKPNNEALKWIAIRLKEYARCWGGNPGSDKVSKGVADWSRSGIERVYLEENSSKKTVFAIVSDIYFLYDFLLQRKNLEKKYPSAKFAKYVGSPNDPITTEMEIAKRAEIAKMRKAHEDQLELLKKEERSEDDKLEKEFYTKREEVEERYKIKRQDLVAKQAEEIAALKKSLEMA